MEPSISPRQRTYAYQWQQPTTKFFKKIMTVWCIIRVQQRVESLLQLKLLPTMRRKKESRKMLMKYSVWKIVSKRRLFLSSFQQFFQMQKFTDRNENPFDIGSSFCRSKINSVGSKIFLLPYFQSIGLILF